MTQMIHCRTDQIIQSVGLDSSCWDGHLPPFGAIGNSQTLQWKQTNMMDSITTARSFIVWHTHPFLGKGLS